MIKNKLQKLVYFVILAFILVLPTSVWAGTLGPAFPNANTDDASFQLYYFWDLRDRESFFQVFNKSISPIKVNIQVFNSADDCDEFFFIDNYTPLDTHIYNVRSITSNDTSLHVTGPILDNGFGFVVVTVVNEDIEVVDNPVLLGNFRVVDNSGYEYRSNAAGFPPAIGFTTSAYSFNFNDIDTSVFSDVVGIAVAQSPGVGAVVAAEEIIAIFDDVTIFDEDEVAVDCANVAFTCGTTSIASTTVGFDLGINTAIVNSKGALSICGGSFDKGLFRLEATSTSVPEGFILADFFVGFIGLNNGDGTGSMDVFTASP